MIATLAASLFMGQSTQYDAAFSERLVKWRLQFESALVDPGGDFGYVYIYSETLGPCYSEALYPIGSASERFVISYAGDSGSVIFESRHGSKVLVDWHVPFIAVKKEHKVKGTVPTFLMKHGYEISPKAKLSEKIRRKLESVDAFASFSYHSMMGGFAGIIKSDGSSMANHESGDMISIVPEENALLEARAKQKS